MHVFEAVEANHPSGFVAHFDLEEEALHRATASAPLCSAALRLEISARAATCRQLVVAVGLFHPHNLIKRQGHLRVSRATAPPRVSLHIARICVPSPRSPRRCPRPRHHNRTAHLAAA
jgi:hypothetical protein